MLKRYHRNIQMNCYLRFVPPLFRSGRARGDGVGYRDRDARHPQCGDRGSVCGRGPRFEASFGILFDRERRHRRTRHRRRVVGRIPRQRRSRGLGAHRGAVSRRQSRSFQRAALPGRRHRRGAGRHDRSRATRWARAASGVDRALLPGGMRVDRGHSAVQRIRLGMDDVPKLDRGHCGRAAGGQDRFDRGDRRARVDERPRRSLLREGLRRRVFG